MVDDVNWYHNSPLSLFFLMWKSFHVLCLVFQSFQLSGPSTSPLFHSAFYVISCASLHACLHCFNVPLFSVLSISIYYSAIVHKKGSCAVALVWAELSWVFCLLLTLSVVHLSPPCHNGAESVGSPLVLSRCTWSLSSALAASRAVWPEWDHGPGAGRILAVFLEREK